MFEIWKSMLQVCKQCFRCLIKMVTDSLPWRRWKRFSRRWTSRPRRSTSVKYSNKSTWTVGGSFVLSCGISLETIVVRSRADRFGRRELFVGSLWSSIDYHCSCLLQSTFRDIHLFFWQETDGLTSRSSSFWPPGTRVLNRTNERSRKCSTWSTRTEAVPSKRTNWKRLSLPSECLSRTGTLQKWWRKPRWKETPFTMTVNVSLLHSTKWQSIDSIVWSVILNKLFKYFKIKF